MHREVCTHMIHVYYRFIEFGCWSIDLLYRKMREVLHIPIRIQEISCDRCLVFWEELLGAIRNDSCGL